MKNEDLFGIPQGAPISDLIANFYMLEFDLEMAKYIKAKEGFYWRYSDDILLVLPGGKEAAQKAEEFAANLISTFGKDLKIKPEKTSISKFVKTKKGLTFEDITKQQFGKKHKKKNGLEYLGFRFDGKKVFLRDSTLSGYYRKITRSAYHASYNFIAQNSDKNLTWLIKKFDYKGFFKRFDRAPKEKWKLGYRGWTFWTYALRSIEEFGPKGNGIVRQMKGHKKKIRAKVEKALEKAYKNSLKST